MQKELIINDPKFIEISYKYNFDIDSIEIYEDIIYAYNNSNNITIFFNEHYDIVDVVNLKASKFDIRMALIDYKCYFLFNNFLKNNTLEDIYNLANRVQIRPTNHGHSAIYIINGIGYKWISSEENPYLEILSYITFISDEIKALFDKRYQYLIDYYDLNFYENLNILIKGLSKEIKENKNIRICDLESLSNPLDIVKYDIIKLLQSDLSEITLQQIADKLFNILYTPAREVKKIKIIKFSDNNEDFLPWNQEKPLTRERK